jgi:zinc transporter
MLGCTAGETVMEDTRACLHCYVLDGETSGTPLELAALAPDDPRLVWIHLNGRHNDTKKFLKEQLQLDPMIVKVLLAEETRPRIEETEHGTLIMLRGLNHNPGPEPEDLVSIRLWLTPKRIITVSRRRARAITELDERLRALRGPRNTGEFLSMLCAHLNDGIEPALQNLDNSLDDLEEVANTAPDAHLRHDLGGIRKQATLFRRHIGPLRDVVGRLQQMEGLKLSKTDHWSIHDSLDRLTRFVEELDATRERCQILQDGIDSALSARLNRNLYILSVITVIFMPLTFLSGLLGMNVAGIPGAAHPWAFLIVCGVALLLVAVQIVIFRRLKWF